MYRFKIGIILKDKVYIEPAANNNYDILLESLGIENDQSQASQKFVRAALLPDNEEWWKSPREYPEEWKFIIEQDVVPDWFNREEHEKLFRKAVCDWWEEHVLVNQKIDNLSSGFYYLKKCEVKTLCKDVTVSLYNSHIRKMKEDACVDTMWQSSYIGIMRENSYVNSMCGTSRIEVMSENSYVCEMRDSSQVGMMVENSKIGQMRGFSQVDRLWGMSQIGKIQDDAIAIDFRDYPNIKIRVSSNAHYEMVKV